MINVSTEQNHQGGLKLLITIKYRNDIALLTKTLYFSGFLVSYLTLKEMKKKGKVSWLLFYFHRFWR